jgi:hypothetical protein
MQYDKKIEPQFYYLEDMDNEIMMELNLDKWSVQ